MTASPLLRLPLAGLLFLCAALASVPGGVLAQAPQDSVPAATGLRDRQGDFLTDPARNPIDLRDPAAVEQDVQYDPATNRYIVTERIGGSYFRSPTYLTFEEYQDYRERQRQTRYFDQLQGKYQPGVGLNALDDPIDAVDVENSLIDRLFGGTELSIQTRGNVDLTLGFDYRTTDNPQIITRAQRQGGFLFNMNIQLNVTGSIGEKLTLSSTYNTQSNFSFDRQLIKVQYDAAGVRRGRDHPGHPDRQRQPAAALQPHPGEPGPAGRARRHEIRRPAPHGHREPTED